MRHCGAREAYRLVSVCGCDPLLVSLRLVSRYKTKLNKNVPQGLNIWAKDQNIDLLQKSWNFQMIYQSEWLQFQKFNAFKFRTLEQAIFGIKNTNLYSTNSDRFVYFGFSQTAGFVTEIELRPCLIPVVFFFVN